MSIPTKPPTFRSIDWAAEMRRLWGDEWHAREPGYEFPQMNGRPTRHFDDSGDDSGIYSGTHG